MTYGMDDGRYWWDDGERLNQLIRDLFWARWCREADDDDPEDVLRLAEINDWIMHGARFRSEDSTEYRVRISTCRAINELQRGRP
jgi:hypothetical protein